jgi:hypothetical protein
MLSVRRLDFLKQAPATVIDPQTTVVKTPSAVADARVARFLTNKASMVPRHTAMIPLMITALATNRLGAVSGMRGLKCSAGRVKTSTQQKQGK